MPRLRHVLVVVAALALMPCVARAAQEEPMTGMATAMSDSLTGAMGDMMGPMMGQMMEGMMKGLFTALAKPEMANNLATFTKNYFDALIKRGFTRDEALRIVVSVGVPAMPGAK